MDLLADAGQPLPKDFSELDILTPYGTLFRYEDLPVEFELDRKTQYELVKSLHLFVENKLS